MHIFKAVSNLFKNIQSQFLCNLFYTFHVLNLSVIFYCEFRFESDTTILDIANSKILLIANLVNFNPL